MDITENLWEEAILPNEYGIDKKGLFVGDQSYITDAPFWYHSAYVDLDTHKAQIELQYLAEETVEKILITRDLFYSQGWLAKLAGKFKLPIHPRGHKAVQEYLYRADMACTKIGYTSTHAGWQTLPDGTREYVPFGTVQPNPIGAGTKKRFSYISSDGNADDWYSTVLPILEQNPLSVLPFAGALAAPILSLIDAQSVVIDIHNTSSSGKTISGLMAMSIWGRPDRLKINWDSTKIALEQNATAFSDLPLFFDESQLNTYPKDIGVSIYNVANGMGRERGAAGGGTQLTGTWSTVMLSTGEQSLLSIIPQNFSGLDARIIPVEGKTLGALNASQAQALATFVRNSYGHLAPRYIEHLQQTDEKELAARYEQLTEMLRPWGYPGDAIQMRKAETYAPLILAIEQLFQILPEYTETLHILWYILVDFWKDLCKQHQNRQVAYQALGLLFDFHTAHEQQFISTELEAKKRLGTVYKGYVAFLPTTLEDLYKKHNIPTENMLREFKERGWLQLNKHGGIKVKTTIGLDKISKAFYALSEEAVLAYEHENVTSFKDPDDEALENWQAAIAEGVPTYEESHSITLEDVSLATKVLHDAFKS